MMKKLTAKLKPKFMLTYICGKCYFDFANTDIAPPVCFYCGATSGHMVTKKEKISLKVIVARMKRVADRLEENLQNARQIVLPPEFTDEANEKDLARASVIARHLKKSISSKLLRTKKS